MIKAIAEGLEKFSTDKDTLGDAYEYLIGQFAAGSGKKAGEFYTPQQISSILSGIVTLDSQEPATGPRKHLESVFDFACGSGSLLLNVRHRMGPHGIGKIVGQEKNITTYNLARMNMLLHGVKDSEFEIYHGDTLTNEWDALREMNPAKQPRFDAVVANPPFSYRWDPTEALGEDMRFKNYGLAPKSAADFAFLLHGFHYLKQDGVMAIILPHGVLFRGGAEERIRTKLLKDVRYSNEVPLDSVLACLVYAEWRKKYLECAWEYGEPCSPNFRENLVADLPGGEMHLGEHPVFLSTNWHPDWACLQSLHDETVALADIVERDLMAPAVLPEGYDHMIELAHKVFSTWIYYATYLDEVCVNGDMLLVAAKKLMLTKDIQPSELMMMVSLFRYWDAAAEANVQPPPDRKRMFSNKRDYRFQQRALLSATKTHNLAQQSS